MGRPLNKKYFGNRNIGSLSTTTDNGIGGEGLASIALPAQLGSILVCSTATTVPALSIPVPTISGGVQATAQVTWEVESVYVTNGLAGHSYTITTGTTVLTELGGGATFSITAVGSGQGEVQTIVPANRGSFTTIPVVDDTYQIQGGDGNNQAHVKYRVKTIAVLEAGSGYGPSAPAITWNNTGVKGTGPGATTSVLTTDSGAVGSATNQENAIIIHANTNGTGTKVGDIQKQEAARRYRVKTDDGVAVCNLVASNSPAVKQAYILATDQGGATYWVVKLTAHRATLIPTGSGSPQFPLLSLGSSGYDTPLEAGGYPQSVEWTFGTAVAPNTDPNAIDGIVKIENA